MEAKLELLLGMMVVLGIGTIIAMAVWLRIRFWSAWHALARRYDLTEVGNLTFQPRLEGDIQGVSVSVGNQIPGLRNRWKNVILCAARPLPAGIHLGPESSIARLLSGDDVTVGDATFDDAVRVHGDTTLLMALLDAECRVELRRFIGRGGLVEDGWVLLPVRPGLGDLGSELESSLSELVRVVNAIRRPGETVAARLARFATTDPSEAVQLRALDLLAQQHGTSSEALGAAAALRDHGHPLIGARARLLLAQSEELAALVEDRSLPAELRSRALVAWTRADPPAGAAAVLAAAEGGVIALHAGVVVALGSTELALDPEDRAAAAAHVGRALLAGPPSGRTVLGPRVLDLWSRWTEHVDGSWLLGWLEAPEPELAHTAAELLGQVGTTVVVEELRAIVDERGTLDTRSRAALQAIAAIQDRIGAGRGGQLSVAKGPGEAGALSPADLGAERGALARAAQRQGRSHEG